MDDFRDIVERYLAAELKDAEQAELARWLEADPANRRAFLAEVDFFRTVRNVLVQEQQELAKQAETSTSDDLPPIHLDTNALTKKKYVGALSYVLSHTFTPKRLIAGGLAAALLLGTAIAIVSMSGPDTQQPITETPQTVRDIEPVVATLTATRDTQWASATLVPGSDLRTGQKLTLTMGFAEITTKRGAVAMIEAPAIIELIDSDNALHLHAGRMVGVCHTRASKGFVVRTEHAEITDLGTEFGVHARPNAVTTTVFSGEVELTTPGGEPQPITTNQTARVRVDGNNRRVNLYEQPAEGFERLLRPAIVTGARINLEGFEVRVVPRGVYEDALLFTDRTHEINGLDENGIPNALRGGDLIMMPADARPNLTPGTEGIALELDLAQPADVYVLMPDIHELSLIQRYPDWLTKNYEQTQLRVGHDRGEGAAKELSAIGPGNSIDNEFTVWKRSAPAGTITASYGINYTMYGVIVVPKEEGGGPTSQ